MRWISAILLVLSFAAATPALADKRVALVIGNSAYKNVPQLANPRNDATDMAAKLGALGFEVVQGEDLDLAGVRNTIREFVGKLEGADISLFFYAGHGLQVNGNNYMAPIDARLASYNDLDFEMVPMDLVLSAMERNTKTNLIFLDACRDNPLAENLARSMGTRSGAVSRGLAKLGSGVGSLIAFATQPGNVALDGKGRNSPFTAALLKHLGTPGQDITRDLVYVRRDVLEATGGKQVPWDNSSLTGEVVLAPKAAVSDTAAAQIAAPETAKRQQSDNAVELAYWDTIKDSTDKGFFEAYLQQYPQGAFAGLARLKIAVLGQKPAEKSKSGQGPDNAAELAYWNSIKDAGGRSYFEAYLSRWPKGMFADIAGLRIAEFDEADERAKRAAAEKSEQAKSAVAEAEAATVEIAALAQPSPREEAVRSIGPDELALLTQKELSRIGCLSGRVDGKWGSGSQGALKDYAGRQGIRLASLEPSVEILDRLKATSVRVCPPVCGRGMEEKNGRCERTRKETKAAPQVEEKPISVAPAPAETKRTANGRICRICKGGSYGNAGWMRVCGDAIFWAGAPGATVPAVCKN